MCVAQVRDNRNIVAVAISSGGKDKKWKNRKRWEVLGSMYSGGRKGVTAKNMSMHRTPGRKALHTGIGYVRMYSDDVSAEEALLSALPGYRNSDGYFFRFLS